MRLDRRESDRLRQIADRAQRRGLVPAEKVLGLPKHRAQGPANRYDNFFVRTLMRDAGLLVPKWEYQFAPPRKWRFDLCWPDERLYIEIDGGLFSGGRHTRGAALVRDYEKRNAATVLGWRGLWCQPQDMLRPAWWALVRKAMEH